MLTLIFSAFIKVTDIILYKRKLLVKKYYIFGFIPRLFTFRKRNLPRIRLVRDYEYLDMQVPGDLPLPFYILPLYILVFPFLRMKVLMLTFEYTNCAKRKVTANITLNEYEFQLISEKFLNK